MPTRPPIDAFRGSLDLRVLKTLSLEATHGWGISQRVQQLSNGEFEMNQGSLYPAPQRLEKNEKRRLSRSDYFKDARCLIGSEYHGGIQP